VQHPVLMTECLLNPLYARQKMAELLFKFTGFLRLLLARTQCLAICTTAQPGGADKTVRGACTSLKSNLLVVADSSP
jgi:actin-related protein